MMLTFKIAFRNLLRHRRRSILSGLTLLFGFVFLSFAEAINAGTYSTLIEAFTREHTGHAQIHRKGYLDRPTLNKTIQDPARVAGILSHTPGVIGFTPRVLGPALAYFNNKTAPAEVRGIDLKREAETTRILDNVKQGRYPGNAPDSEGRSEALIGAGLAEILKAKLGDELVLISQGGDGSVANDRFAVVGISGTSDSPDRMTVTLPIAAAQNFFVLPDQVHEFALLFRNHKEAIPMAERIGREIAPQMDLSVEPWQVVEAEFYKGMQVDRKGNTISYAIILFIVCVGVLNVILMSILERTREFGVLKAIGTRPLDLFRLIVLETGTLASLSVAFGLLIAIPLNYWFQKFGITLSSPIEMGGIRMDRMVAELSFETLAGPALMVLLASLLTCLFPAIRAARIRVVEALRSA